MRYVIQLMLMVGSVSLALGAEPQSCTLDSEWSRPRQLLEDVRGENEYSLPNAAPSGLLAAVHELFAAYKERDPGAIKRLTVNLPVHLDEHHYQWIEKEVRILHIYDQRVVCLQTDPLNPQHVRVFSEVATGSPDRCAVGVMMTTWLRLDGKWRILPGGGYVQ